MVTGAQILALASPGQTGHATFLRLRRGAERRGHTLVFMPRTALASRQPRDIFLIPTATFKADHIYSQSLTGQRDHLLDRLGSVTPAPQGVDHHGGSMA